MRVSLNWVKAFCRLILTGQAMVLLCLANFLIRFIPFHLWRYAIGSNREALNAHDGNQECSKLAQRLAAHVERAAARLPFTTKCLPRGIALAWMMRMRAINYTLKLGVRPLAMRVGNDDLHAWVEFEGTPIIGDLPGPWIVLLAITR